jgi:hypothetical protein
MSALASHVEKECHFESQHRDLAGYLPELEGTYARCQRKPLDDLEEVLNHVMFECPWCKTQFERLRDFKDSFRK